MVNTDIKYIKKQYDQEKQSRNLLADLILITFVIGFVALNVFVYALGNLAKSYNDLLKAEQSKYDNFVVNLK